MLAFLLAFLFALCLLYACFFAYLLLAFGLLICSLLACFPVCLLACFFQVDLLDAAKLSYICCKDITEFLRKIVNSLCSC